MAKSDKSRKSGWKAATIALAVILGIILCLGCPVLLTFANLAWRGLWASQATVEPMATPAPEPTPKIIRETEIVTETVIIEVTPTPVATATPEPPAQTSAPAPSTEPVVNNPGESRGAEATTLQNEVQQGQWKLQYFTGATQMMKNWTFSDPDPSWREFPNVDWPPHQFVAAHGLEYGQELSDFCQQDMRCDFPVASRSYRSITGDYSISGIGECAESGTGIGCAVIIVNVGDVTASFRNQMVDMGHTITGLYWHGDYLNEAITALSSHLAYRMIGVPSGVPANPGANCSVPGGCSGVDLTFVILSGNELLLRGSTIISR